MRQTSDGKSSICALCGIVSHVNENLQPSCRANKRVFSQSQAFCWATRGSAPSLVEVERLLDSLKFDEAQRGIKSVTDGTAVAVSSGLQPKASVIIIWLPQAFSGVLQEAGTT